jgi:DUF1680 family protein
MLVNDIVCTVHCVEIADMGRRTPFKGSHGNGGGNHANTHIPEIIGSARGYELTGNETQKDIAVNFFHIVTANHSWATGGSNDGEHWTTPNRMGDQLNADTEESCTQYNILKVARHLFKWTASSSLGDFYERAIMVSCLPPRSATCEIGCRSR